MTANNERAAASAESQKQSTSTEKDFKKNNAPEKNSDEIQFFDTTISKLVERENPETGEKETVEVLSDNLYPGEKLKRADDEEKAAAKAEERKAAAREAAGKDAEVDNRDVRK